jgi:hypothetical protein
MIFDAAQKDIKFKLAEKLATMETDPVLFLDLYFEQKVFDILKEESYGGVRTGLMQRIWDVMPFRDKAEITRKQYDLKGKFIEAMNFLTNLENIISNRPNSSQWNDTIQVQNIFNDMLKSINSLQKDSNLIKNVSDQIQKAAVGAKITGAKNIDFKLQVLDPKLSKEIKTINSTDQLELFLDKVNNDDEAKRKLLLAAKSTNISLPKYSNIQTVINNLTAYNPASFTSLTNKILQFSNNNSSITRKILFYLLEKTMIPQFLLSQDINAVTLQKIKNVKSLEELSSLTDSLNPTEKAKISQIGKDLDITKNTEFKNALLFYNTKLKNTKYNDLVDSLINKIKNNFGITDANHALHTALYLLYSSPVLEAIKSGKSDAYGGSDPMKNIKSFDDIGSYFSSLTDEQKHVVDVMASTADPNKEPLKSGIKAYDEIISSGWQNIIRTAYAKINRFLNHQNKTKTLMSFILGQTDLVEAFEEASKTMTLFGEAIANPTKLATNKTKMEWDPAWWEEFKKNHAAGKDDSIILKSLIEKYLNVGSSGSSGVPSRNRSRSRSRTSSGTP